jgi:hypothetical protein
MAPRWPGAAITGGKWPAQENAQLSGVRVEHGVGHGGHDIALLEVLHLAVQLAQGIGRAGEFQRVCAQGAADAAHDDRGAEPGARDVAHHHAQLARGQDEHVIPVAADVAGPRHIPGGDLRSLTAGSAEGTRLRCRASAAAWSSRDLSDCTASAARSAANWSRAASSVVKTRLRTVPTCSTPITVPWTSNGTAEIPLRTIEPEPWSLGIRFQEQPADLHRFVISAGAPAAGTPVGGLPLPEDAWISFIIRAGRLVPAHTGTLLRAGDEVAVFASGKDEASLRELFGA